LPRTSSCRDDLFHSLAPDSTPKLAVVAAVTVANQIAWSILFAESLNHLLTLPFGSGMLRDSKVKHPSMAMFQNKEHEQHPQSDRWHGEEIGRNDLPDMVL
jgi:hypothetical protein